MSPEYAGTVTDEAEFMGQHLPLGGARLVELGCGSAQVARALLQRRGVAEVKAFEVDAQQHAANLKAASVPGLHFVEGVAQATGLPSASCDGVMMLKSLHHVPMPQMDQALDEIARILVPGGWLYVSEPVYAGEFNEVVKLFNDEGEVRAAAYEALIRAGGRGQLVLQRELVFDTPLHFRDFDDFLNRIVRVTYSDRHLPAATEGDVRAKFERFMTPSGAGFVRQMRIDILRRR